MTQAIAILRSLERRERGRVGSTKLARSSLAAKLKVGVGTVENLVRDRVKSIDASLRDRLQALLIHELETEIARLTHELEVARQTGLRLDCDVVVAVESHLASARSLLAGATSGERVAAPVADMDRTVRSQWHP